MLTDDEHEQLTQWARRRKSLQALALRSPIMLECATGAANTVVVAIGRVWKASRLKPHRAAGFKLSDDPLFVEKIYDIVGLLESHSP